MIAYSVVKEFLNLLLMHRLGTNPSHIFVLRSRTDTVIVDYHNLKLINMFFNNNIVGVPQLNPMIHIN